MYGSIPINYQRGDSVVNMDVREGLLDEDNNNTTGTGHGGGQV